MDQVPSEHRAINPPGSARPFCAVLGRNHASLLADVALPTLLSHQPRWLVLISAALIAINVA